MNHIQVARVVGDVMRWSISGFGELICRADPVVIGTPTAKEIVSDKSHRYRLQLPVAAPVQSSLTQRATLRSKFVLSR